MKSLQNFGKDIFDNPRDILGKSRKIGLDLIDKIPFVGSATVPTNNYQRTSAYTDNKTVNIFTNATSGPSIASYIKNNDLIRGGYGTSGAF